MIHEHDTRLQRNFISAAFELKSPARDRLTLIPREWFTDFASRTARDAILSNPNLDCIGYAHTLVANGTFQGHREALTSFPSGMTQLPRRLDFVVDQLRESFVRHQVECFTDTVSKASGADLTADERLDVMERALSEIRHLSHSGLSSYDHIKVGAMAAYQDIIDTQQAMKDAGRTKAIPTGIDVLDAHLFGGGFRGGQHVIVAARPGVGKSSFMANTALHQAKAGYTVGIISLEMTARHLAEVIAQIESSCGFQKFYREPLTEWESKTLEAGIQRVCGLPIWVDDSSRKTVEQVAARLAQMVNVEKCDIVYVDYAQKIAFSGKDDAVRELNHISDRLTESAKELGVPVVSLAQLNRDASNATPKLENIKGSGQFEQDAHIALLLHRPNADKEGSTEQMEIHLAKQRRGIANAHVTVTFDRRTQRIA